MVSEQWYAITYESLKDSLATWNKYGEVEANRNEKMHNGLEET